MQREPQGVIAVARRSVNGLMRAVGKRISQVIADGIFTRYQGSAYVCMRVERSVLPAIRVVPQRFCLCPYSGAKAFFVVPRIFAATYIFLIERNEYYGENPLQNLFN